MATYMPWKNNGDCYGAGLVQEGKKYPAKPAFKPDKRWGEFNMKSIHRYG